MRFGPSQHKLTPVEAVKSLGEGPSEALEALIRAESRRPELFTRKTQQVEVVLGPVGQRCTWKGIKYT